MKRFKYRTWMVDKSSGALGNLVSDCNALGDDGWELIQLIEDHFSWTAILKKSTDE